MRVEHWERELDVEGWREARRVDGMRPGFVEMLDRAGPAGKRVLDVCTGTGTVALRVAEAAELVVGVDVSVERLRTAEAEARSRGLDDVLFLAGDVESTPYDAFLRGGEAVTSRLCMSREIVELAGSYLPPGGLFVFACHGTDHWQETGRGSGHAFGEEELLGMLEESGLHPVRVEVDTAVVRYGSLRELEEELGERLVERWMRDSRWSGLRRSFSGGRKTLTRSVVVGAAERASGERV